MEDEYKALECFFLIVGITLSVVGVVTIMYCHYAFYGDKERMSAVTAILVMGILNLVAFLIVYLVDIKKRRELEDGIALRGLICSWARGRDCEDKKEDIDMSNKNNRFTKNMSDYYTKEYFKKLETGENIKRLFDLEIEERFILGNAIADDRKVYIDEEGYLINDITDNREQYAGTDMNYGMLKILIKEHSSLYYIEKIPSKIDKRVIRDYIKLLEERVKSSKKMFSDPHVAYNNINNSITREQISVLALTIHELEDLLEKGDK